MVGTCHRLIYDGAGSPQFFWASQNIIATMALLDKLLKRKPRANKGPTKKSEASSTSPCSKRPRVPRHDIGSRGLTNAPLLHRWKTTLRWGSHPGPTEARHGPHPFDTWGCKSVDIPDLGNGEKVRREAHSNQQYNWRCGAASTPMRTEA